MFGATCDALARRGLTSEICGRDAQMTYVVNDSCIRCKTTDCVAVCPVNCFYEGENMLVIHPDECIDCGVCEPECPVDAIKPDSEPGLEKWLELNREYARTCRKTHGTTGTRPGNSTRTFRPSRVRAAEQAHPGNHKEVIARRPSWPHAAGIFFVDRGVPEDVAELPGSTLEPYSPMSACGP